MIIYLGSCEPAASRDVPLLSSSGLGEPPITADSEIAAGRIALFSRSEPRREQNGMVSVALARSKPCANLDCRRLAPPPWLSPGALALRGPDFPLTLAGQRSSFHPFPQLSMCMIRKTGSRRQAIRPVAWCRGGDSNSHGLPHYALNVARLPVPPHRHSVGANSGVPEPTPGLEPGTCCLRNSCSTN
jgi:hypothetical protein